MAYGRKTGGFMGNMTKLGGKSPKLALKSDMKPGHLASSNFKKARKQPHKKV